MEDTEYTHLVFPARLVPGLASERGDTWQELVLQAAQLPASALEKIAFVLMIARICGCTSCHANALRALRGCLPCARQSLTRFRGSDQELVALYEQSCGEVLRYLKNGRYSSPS